MQRLLLILLLPFTILAVNGLTHDTNSQADTAFFSSVHLGMTIDEARKSYHKLGNVAALWHSGAPPGQEQVDFRSDTVPQRRTVIYYSVADNKILSVIYWKLGEGETFSKAERNHLIKLSGNRADLTVTIFAEGSEFEVTTPKQFKIEDSNP
jgi:hypothetical protein